MDFWQALQLESLERLRAAAKAGSTSAAVALSKLVASRYDEATRMRCQQHLDLEQVGAMLLQVFDAVRVQVLGVSSNPVFVGVEPELREAIIDAVDLAADGLNARLSAEEKGVLVHA